jgi:hypothetical protein
MLRSLFLAQSSRDVASSLDLPCVASIAHAEFSPSIGKGGDTTSLSSKVAFSASDVGEIVHTFEKEA